MGEDRVVRVEVSVDFGRFPRRLRPLVALPALCNLVDAMKGAPFRFYGELVDTNRVEWTAEVAR